MARRRRSRSSPRQISSGAGRPRERWSSAPAFLPALPRLHSGSSLYFGAGAAIPVQPVARRRPFGRFLAAMNKVSSGFGRGRNQTLRPVLAGFARSTAGINTRNVCHQRKVRKEALFAARVAGRRWGSGGPNMNKARRTADSNYSCAR